MGSDVTSPDGSLDFSGGVDSLKTPTVSSPQVPNGLNRNQIAWGSNLTMRDGSLSPRDGWANNGIIISATNVLAPLLASGNSLFQGAAMYEPDVGTPYLISVVGGHVLKIDPDFNTQPIDLSLAYGLYHPATSPKCFFSQAENYMVIQAGDYNPASGNGTLPLIWNGSVLTRSNGLTGTTVIGTAVPNFYVSDITAPFTITAATTPPFGVGGSTKISLAVAYPGNVGDKITITSGPYSVTFGSNTVIGNFCVVTIDNSIGNSIYVQTVSTGYAGSTALIADGPFTFQLEIPSAGATQAVDVLTQLPAFPLASSESPSIGVPPVGTPVTLLFTGGTYLYPGSVLDVIQIWHNGTNYGTFQILDIFAGGIQFQSVAPLHVGSPFNGALTWIQLYNTGTGQDYFLIPSAGQSINVLIDSQYIGSAGDTINVPGAGTFTVTSTGAYLNEGPITIRAIVPVNMGSVFPYGFTLTVTAAPSTVGTLINQIPAATCMVYYQGRLWYAQGRTVSAGDIVGGPSGTSVNSFRDSVLAVTENPLAVGGDGFALPIQAGNITGLAVSATIDAPLGQGLLMVGTARQICSLQVPITRADWIASGSNNLPQIDVVQLANGWINQESITSVNGDLFFWSMEPDIRSLITAVRYFQQWGNVTVASNEYRALQQTDRTILQFATGIYWNNYLIMCAMPKQTPFGVVHQALLPLDFEPILTLEQQLPPNWNGVWEGLQTLSLQTATFNGQQRAFILSLSSSNPGQIELWEMIQDSNSDANDTRIAWHAELPAFTWDEEFDLKQLVSAEIWLSGIIGTCNVKVEYRPDSSACWLPWTEFQVCSARNSAENLTNPVPYPVVQYPPGFAQTLTLPEPKALTVVGNERLSTLAYQFQPRITGTGQFAIRGFLLHAEMKERQLYANMVL